MAHSQALTSQAVRAAASVVRAIASGAWTHDSPSWAPVRYKAIDATGNLNQDYVRAVQTAEAFALLLRGYADGFDEKAFITVCGFDRKAKVAR